MHLVSILLAVALYCCLSGCQTVTNPAGETAAGLPGSQVLLLNRLADPARWSTAECTVDSAPVSGEQQPVLHLHIPVDHQGGEAKHPVGWPRIYFTTLDGESEWFAYDTFTFALHTQVSRPDMEKIPLSFTVFCGSKSFSQSISARHGEWMQISIPCEKLPAPGRVTGLRVSIEESKYKHLDVLDFKLSEFRLSRSPDCEITDLFVGVPQRGNGLQLPLSLKVTGAGSDQPRGVPLQISQGERILRLETLPVRRGDFSLLLDLSELQLQAGQYTLTVFPGQSAKTLTRAFELK